MFPGNSPAAPFELIEVQRFAVSGHCRIEQRIETAPDEAARQFHFIRAMNAESVRDPRPPQPIDLLSQSLTF